MLGNKKVVEALMKMAKDIADANEEGNALNLLQKVFSFHDYDKTRSYEGFLRK